MKIYSLLNPEHDHKTLEIFSNHGITCISIPPCKRLQKPVCTHPDMLFFKLSDGSILTEKLYFEENQSFFEKLPKDLKIKTSKLKLAPDYPNDIAFDALKVENTLFCLEKYTAPEIIANAEKVVNIKQGYSKCSSLVIGSSVITADPSIFSAVTANGFDCLLISSQGISLNGYGCGFIGGATAVIEEQKSIVFFGNITLHPSYSDIRAFCEKKGYKLHFNCNSYPKDQGSALFFSV